MEFPLPNGFAVGSTFNAIQTLQDILKYAEGKIENVLIGHEVGTWEQYESEADKDGMHVAYVVRIGEENESNCKNFFRAGMYGNSGTSNSGNRRR